MVLQLGVGVPAALLLLKADALLDASRPREALAAYQEALQAEFPEVQGKILLLSRLIDRSFDIEDPFGGSLDCCGGTGVVVAAGLSSAETSEN